MHPLHQRLKELDWDTFQRLCFQLIAERHPGSAIRHVEGAGGDRGLDLFLGELRSGPTIWQCKHFRNGLGPRQRPQVLKSLRDAVSNFKPRTWILVTSADLDVKGHLWFQKLQSNYARNTQIGLFQGSDVVRELIHRRRLREAFFPGAVVEGVMVRRALIELGEKSLSELDLGTREKLDEMIARLEDADSRFNYRLSYGPDVGAGIAEERPSNPLLLASFVDNEKRVDIFARDLTALKLDPPTVDFSVTGDGMAKLQEFLKTGRKQELGEGEVTIARSTFDFLLPKGEIKSWSFALLPSPLLSDRRLKLRLTFANATSKIVYDYIEFKVVRAGTDEAEVASVSKLPFSMSLSLGLKAQAESTFGVTDHLKGWDVRAAAKFLTALSLFRKEGRLELFDLEHDRELGTMEIGDTELPARHESLQRIFSAAATVGERFGIALKVPERITQKDLDSLGLLQSVVDGSPQQAQSFSATLVKEASRSRAVEESVTRDQDVVVTWPHIDPLPVLFSKPVETGPVMLVARNAKVDEPSEFLARFSKASDGEGVPIKFHAAEVRLQLGAAGPA